MLKAVFYDVGSFPRSKGNVMLKSFKRLLATAAAFTKGGKSVTFKYSKHLLSFFLFSTKFYVLD